MKVPLHTTLKLRLSLYTALIVIIFAVGISLWLLTTEKQEIIGDHLRQLEFAGKQFSDSHIDRLNDITRTAIAINKSIEARIGSGEKAPPSIYKPSEIKRREDGALRIDDGISGAFLAKSSPITPHIHNLFFFTKRSFELIEPVVKSHFFNFYFISPDNFIRISPPKWAMTIDADHDFSEDPFYRIGTPEENPKREVRWTQIYYDSIWQHWMTSIIIPVYHNDEFLGITGCDIVMDEFFDKVLEFSSRNKGVKAFLVDSDGHIIVHPEVKAPPQNGGDSMNAPYPLFKDIDSVDLSVSQYAIHQTVPPHTTHQISDQNNRYYFTYYSIPGQQWYLCITIGEDTMLDNFDRVIASVVLFSVILGLVLFLALRYLVNKSILSRLDSLRTTIQHFSSGELNSTVAITGNDEIGSLERGVQAMQTSIQEKIKALVAAQQTIQISEAKYRNYIDNAPNGIFITDAQGHYLEVNNHACEITGYSKEELLTKMIADLLAPDMQDAGITHFNRVIKEGYASGIFAYLTKKGERRYWSVDAVKLNEHRMLGFVNDVTSIRKNEEELEKYRTQLELLVRERTAELEEKNQELEKFNKLFVGREFRIKELRTKIHELTERLSHYEKTDAE